MREFCLFSVSLLSFNVLSGFSAVESAFNKGLAVKLFSNVLARLIIVILNIVPVK